MCSKELNDLERIKGTLNLIASDSPIYNGKLKMFSSLKSV